MPKTIINYDNTIIYKIVCNDLNIMDCYVGHTTNFIKRKQQHKNNCFNEKSNGYNFKIYTMIRDNGGWDNWIMVEIEKYPCNDRNEAAARERHWYETLNASLNMLCPNRSKKECEQLYYERNRDMLMEKSKTYYDENKVKIRVRDKKYYEDNKKEIYEMTKLYREQHKEKYKEYMKKYHEDNKDKYSEKNKEYFKKYQEEKGSLPYECECGAIFQFCSKARHFKGIKHKQYLESI